MTDLTGTRPLTAFIVRRDRVRILVWTGVIGLLAVASAASIKGLYRTQADLDEAARASRDNAGAIVFNGPDQALDTVGGQVAFQIGSFSLVMTALMSIFMIGRETRAEEESGRLDLIRAMAVGRRAPTAAALLVGTAMSLAVGLMVAIGLLAQGLPTAGSLIFGASLAAIGLVFAGIALVVAQITENTRVVYGASGAILGAAFALRAAGDVSDGTLSWLSPIGWSQKTRPYAGERLWPLLVSLTAAAGLVALAVTLASRRDVGAGLVPPRPGPATGRRSLGRPLGLALRLQRGSLVGWSAGLFLGGVAYGSVANDVEDFLGDNEAVRDIIARSLGATLTDSYLATSLLMLALIAAGFTISAVLRLRSEETSLHAEPILATRTSRLGWLSSHLTVAGLGSVVAMAAGGLGVGLSYGIASRDLGQIPRLLAASLTYLPALWLLAGVTVTLFGRSPRASGAAWGVLAGCFVIGLLGQIFNFPSWLTGLSPFEHIPQVPAADLTLTPLVAVTALAAALSAGGIAAFRHRDVA